MARKQRALTLKISLTKKAYKQIEEAAFKNCRTPEQEASFMVEKQLSGIAIAREPVRYDDPTPAPEAEGQHPAVEAGPQTIPDWTTEQEAEVNARCREAGLSDAEISVAKMVHKTPEAVIASLKELTAA